jgi:hypothetical protein
LYWDARFLMSWMPSNGRSLEEEEEEKKKIFSQFFQLSNLSDYLS